MIDLERILKQNADVDDYRIVSKAVDSYEVFFVHRKLETVRATQTVDTDVTVYVRHDDRIGDSSFAVYASMSEDEVAKKVEAAVSRAKLVSNQPYEIPQGGEVNVTVESNFADYEMPELAAKIADAVFAADCYEGGSINATEIFLYKDVVNVKNSHGVNKTQTKYHAMIEAIPTWNEGKESVELYEDHRFTYFDAAKVTEEINRRMVEVRDRQIAVKPQTPMTCNVLLNAHEIEELLGDIAQQMHFQMVYSKANLYQIGDDLQKDGKGDRLTMTVVKGVHGGVHSAQFDADGLDLVDRTIVDHGVVTNFFGDNRFAQYLGQVPTGNLRCIRLNEGSLTAEEIASAPYLECMSLSGLQVDMYNDYIGGEIRLAYYFDGEKTIPVTGISMSAKLSEVVANLRLSKTTTTTNAYEGPEKLMMLNVAVL